VKATRFLPARFCFILVSTFAAGAADARSNFNARDYGAVGEGKNLDSPAINKAITAAAEVGRLKKVKEFSPIELVMTDVPPVYLIYTLARALKPSNQCLD